jgi:hypothetical protein
MHHTVHLTKQVSCSWPHIIGKKQIETTLICNHSKTLDLLAEGMALQKVNIEGDSDDSPLKVP